VVIQIRAAEGAHEEIVGERVLAGPLPAFERAAVEMRHGPAAHIRHGDEHVVAAAVDLLLVVKEGMDGIGKELGGGEIERRCLDGKRPIGQKREARVRFAAVEYDEIRERRAVVIELRLLLVGRLRNPVRSGEESIEVIEAAILRVDHHDGLDPRQVLVRYLRGRARAGEHACRRNGSCEGRKNAADRHEKLPSMQPNERKAPDDEQCGDDTRRQKRLL
jgi:hypothetical protein